MKIETFALVPGKETAIYKQLFDFIKENIIAGHFLPGDTLPSSRRLAVDMSISRTSVLNAYTALIAEGYISSRKGAGYTVNSLPAAHPPEARKEEVPVAINHSGYAPFSAEPIDTSLFPLSRWAKILSKIARTASLSMVNTSQYDVFGNRDFREILCEYLYESKGISCRAGQIIITAGSMESLEICINALTVPGQMLSLEDPCYPLLRSYTDSQHRFIHAMPVDESGARCDTIPANSRMAIITPGNQFPLGVTMPTERKLEFVQWAHNNQTWVVEDDYDGDFYFNNRKTPTLAALDTHDRTIYLGNFSKLITSEFRIAFIVVPVALLPRISKLNYTQKVSYLPQVVLSEFIRTGDFYRYLLKARNSYAEKRLFLITLLNKILFPYGKTYGDPAGSLVVFIFSVEIDDVKIVSRAKEQGLSLRALSQFFCHDQRSGLVMGYLFFNRDTLKTAVHLLKKVLEEYCQGDNIPGR